MHWSLIEQVSDPIFYIDQYFLIEWFVPNITIGGNNNKHSANLNPIETCMLWKPCKQTCNQSACNCHDISHATLVTQCPLGNCRNIPTDSVRWFENKDLWILLYNQKCLYVCLSTVSSAVHGLIGTKLGREVGDWNGIRLRTWRHGNSLLSNLWAENAIFLSVWRVRVRLEIPLAVS